MYRQKQHYIICIKLFTVQFLNKNYSIFIIQVLHTFEFIAKNVASLICYK